MPLGSRYPSADVSSEVIEEYVPTYLPIVELRVLEVGIAPPRIASADYSLQGHGRLHGGRIGRPIAQERDRLVGRVHHHHEALRYDLIPSSSL